MQDSTRFQILIKYFLDNFPLETLLDQAKPKNWQEGRGKFYFEKILELDSVLRKIEKYPIYFSAFYPPPQIIPQSEAVEYHWHSYIQDIYILKERIIGIISSLEKDLPRYDLANPKDAILLLNHLKKNVMKGLENTLEFRGEHTHKKTARNFDITRANALHLIKESAGGFNLAVNKLDEKIQEFTEKSKVEHIEMARKNNQEMGKLRDFFAPRFGHLFASLNGHDYSIFKMD